MPPNQTLDAPAARGPEVRRSAISGFCFLLFVFDLATFSVSAFQFFSFIQGPVT